MTTVKSICWCGKSFTAKSADVKRGWARCCCKSHAAHAREKRLDRFGFQKGESGDFQTRLDEMLSKRAAHSGQVDWKGGGDAHKKVF